MCEYIFSTNCESFIDIFRYFDFDRTPYFEPRQIRSFLCAPRAAAKHCLRISASISKPANRADQARRQAADTASSVAEGLSDLYQTKLKELEKESLFTDLISKPLTTADFMGKPQVPLSRLWPAAAGFCIDSIAFSR